MLRAAFQKTALRRALLVGVAVGFGLGAFYYGMHPVMKDALGTPGAVGFTMIMWAIGFRTGTELYEGRRYL